MNPVILAWLIPADIGEQIKPIMLDPDPVIGEDPTYLPAMYGPMQCNIVQRVACECIPESCVWCDEDAWAKFPPPPMNLRASILAGRELHGACILVGDDGMRTTHLKIKRIDQFFHVLNLLATTVSAVTNNASNKPGEGASNE